MNLLGTLWYYWKTKRLSFHNRAELVRYQEKRLARFRRRVLTKSPYFKRYLTQPFSQWPLMNKQIMMDHFDKMNTAHLTCAELFDCAQQSELSKDFTPKVGKFSVGLSSGTSGRRGLFVVSEQEQQMWAGGMLAKMLPRGLFAKERVALFLRADNHLYHSVNSRWLSLRFFGLFDNFQQQLSQLVDYQPTIIVAPAQVLSAIAHAKLAGELTIAPGSVISSAEVLEHQDRQRLEQAFAHVGEVYQATEGFLAATCPLGTLHLNEEFIYIEPHWLDENRFTPIITDFTRTTQPIVRYQLDDILVRRTEPCLCGRQGMPIAYIEGRQDDQLMLMDSQSQPLTIFADYCRRIIANTLPLTCDYRLIQQDAQQIQLIGCCETSDLLSCRDKLNQYFIEQGADITHLMWQITPVTTIPATFVQKRRRIIRQWSPHV